MEFLEFLFRTFFWSLFQLRFFPTNQLNSILCQSLSDESVFELAARFRHHFHSATRMSEIVCF